MSCEQVEGSQPINRMSETAAIGPNNPNVLRHATLSSNDGLTTRNLILAKALVYYDTHQNLEHMFFMNGLLHLGMFVSFPLAVQSRITLPSPPLTNNPKITRLLQASDARHRGRHETVWIRGSKGDCWSTSVV
jgi:hypothetical protein